MHNIETGRVSPTAHDPKYKVAGFLPSPDGRWLVFTLNKGGQKPSQAFIAPARTDRPSTEAEWYPVSAESYVHRPMWSPDGNAIYYYQLDEAAGRFICLFMRRLDPVSKRPIGEPVVVRHFHGDLRPAVGNEGTALLPDKLFLPLYEVGGQIWLAEQTR
jgi:hypothetical protein